MCIQRFLKQSWCGSCFCFWNSIHRQFHPTSLFLVDNRHEGWQISCYGNPLNRFVAHTMDSRKWMLRLKGAISCSIVYWSRNNQSSLWVRDDWLFDVSFEPGRTIQQLSVKLSLFLFLWPAACHQFSWYIYHEFSEHLLLHLFPYLRAGRFSPAF